MLLGAAIIGAIAQRIRAPYAVALVVAGLVGGQVFQTELPRIDPDLVLFVFLPPLLFDAAFRFDARELRLIAKPVLLLAIPGTLLTAALSGAILTIFLNFNLTEGLLFGSMAAATDAVAVIAIIKRLGLPHRLGLVIEGESLFNDGIAITLYTVLSTFLLTGTLDSQPPVQVFLVELFGGAAIGAALAFALSRVTIPIDDHLLEMMFTTSLAYGSFLLADSVHASGPIACVAAGLIHGSYGREIGMSLRTSNRLDDLWEYLGFVANALLFLLVGFTIHLRSLWNHLGEILIAFAALLVARTIVVWATSKLLEPKNDYPRRRSERIVIVWAGLRGALTIVLALGLPSQTPQLETLTSMAFGVVLLSLVLQGLTLPPLIRWLGVGRSGRPAAPAGRTAPVDPGLTPLPGEDPA